MTPDHDIHTACSYIEQLARDMRSWRPQDGLEELTLKRQGVMEALDRIGAAGERAVAEDDREATVPPVDLSWVRR